MDDMNDAFIATTDINLSDSLKWEMKAYIEFTGLKNENKKLLEENQKLSKKNKKLLEENKKLIHIVECKDFDKVEYDFG